MYFIPVTLCFGKCFILFAASKELEMMKPETYNWKAETKKVGNRNLITAQNFFAEKTFCLFKMSFFFM